MGVTARGSSDVNCPRCGCGMEAEVTFRQQIGCPSLVEMVVELRCANGHHVEVVYPPEAAVLKD